MWLLINLFSFFLHINTTQTSRKYPTFLENSFVHVRRAHFFLTFTPCMRKSSITMTVSLDCSTHQIFSVGESSVDPQRTNCRFSIYNQTLPMLYHAVHFIGLISALLQTASDAFFLGIVSLQIVMRNLTNQEVATFTYGDWLSKVKNAKGSLVCEMPAMVNDEQMMEDTTYTIQVKTSDIGGMSMVDTL